MNKVYAVGGLAALIFLWGRNNKAEITAAEGNDPLKLVESVFHQLGSDLGKVVSVPVGIVSEPLSIFSESKSASPNVQAIGETPHLLRGGGLSFEEKVTGSGFSWDKSGRYQYNQAIKTAGRQAKAEGVGFSDFGEYSRWQQKRHAPEFGPIPEFEGAFVGPDTRVYSEEQLGQEGWQNWANVFRVQEQNAGVQTSGGD